MVLYHNVREGSIFQNIDFNTLTVGADHEGVYYGLDVRQSGVGTTMNVVVGSGMAIVQGNRTIGSFFNLVVPTAHATLPRYDLVEMRSDGNPAYVAGVAAATPTVSGLTSGAIPLAVVFVGSLVTGVVSTNIRDLRTRITPLYPFIETIAANTMTSFINSFRSNPSGNNLTKRSELPVERIIFEEFILGSKTNYQPELTIGVNTARIQNIGSVGMFIMGGSNYDIFNSTFDHIRWTSGNPLAGRIDESTSGIYVSCDQTDLVFITARGSGTVASTAGEFRGLNIDGWAIMSVHGRRVGGATNENVIRIIATNYFTGAPVAGSRVNLAVFNISSTEDTRESRIVHFDRTGSQVNIYTPQNVATGSLLTVATVSLSTLAGSWYIGMMCESTAAGASMSGGILHYSTFHASGLSGLLTSTAVIVPTTHRYAIANSYFPVGSFGLMRVHHSFNSGTNYSTVGSLHWLQRNATSTGSYVVQFVYNFPPPAAGSSAGYNFCVMQDWEAMTMEDVI